MHFRVKDIRKQEGLTQEELSKKSGVSRAIISSLETNSEVITSTLTLQKIATALGRKVSDLFFEDDV
jgi:transcriptional regulator with XRE-family HTH domain